MPKPTRQPAHGKPTILRCDLLEDRTVPAILDLTAVGSAGTVNGAVLQQSGSAWAGDYQFSPFLGIQNRARGRGGEEAGYNTDAARLQFDTIRSDRMTHALDLRDVPVVTINGESYREFVLDINQTKGSPFLSLDRVQVFVANSNRLQGYNERTDKLDGRTAIYDLDAGRGNNAIKLDARKGFSAQQGGDMRMYVRDSLFNGQFVYVYSEFGARHRANGGAEVWGTRHAATVPPTVPPPAPSVGTISGSVFVDTDQDMIRGEGEIALDNWTVFIDSNGNDILDEGEVSTTTNADGQYSFTLAAGAEYSVRVVHDFDWIQNNPPYDPIALSAGQAVTGIDFGFIPPD